MTALFSATPDFESLFHGCLPKLPATLKAGPGDRLSVDHLRGSRGSDSKAPHFPTWDFLIERIGLHFFETGGLRARDICFTYSPVFRTPCTLARRNKL